jgi:hypothetical protein
MTSIFNVLSLSCMTTRFLRKLVFFKSIKNELLTYVLGPLIGQIFDRWSSWISPPFWSFIRWLKCIINSTLTITIWHYSSWLLPPCWICILSYPTSGIFQFSENGEELTLPSWIKVSSIVERYSSCCKIRIW